MSKRVQLLHAERLSFTTVCRMKFPKGTIPAEGMRLTHGGKTVGTITGYIAEASVQQTQLASLRENMQKSIYECTVDVADEILLVAHELLLG